MRLYKEKDVYDWIIRISIIPEFIYSNVLSVVVLGSYLFFIFNIFTRTVTHRSGLTLQRFVTRSRKLFYSCGYTEGWGTRVN